MKKTKRKKDPIATGYDTEAFLSANYDFRYNEVTNKVEFKRKDDENYSVLTDYAFNSILRKCTKNGFEITTSALRSLLNSDYTEIFNPFHRYLYGLPQYDSSDQDIDYIVKLSSKVSTTNDELWHKAFKKWFVALVGSLLVDKLINHTVIILSGPQGIGKTTWILNLIPEELKNYIFSGTINPGNKDTLIFLSECMLINLDELENLNRTELGSIKELITKNSVKLRRPYGTSVEDFPRRASFAGSVNTMQFLTDSTGSRRFLCFEVTSIDIDTPYSADDLNKAYSQAHYLFKNGFKYWFEKEEITEIAQNNERYRLLSAEEEILIKHFEPCEEFEADHLFSTTEILEKLHGFSKFAISSGSVQKLGKALQSNGFKKLKKRGRQVYAIKAIVVKETAKAPMILNSDILSELEIELNDNESNMN